MKIKLTVTERLLALGLLNEFKGTLSDMAEITDDVKKDSTLAFGEAETKELNLTQDVTKNTVTWDLKKAKDVDVELSKTSIDYLLKVIEDKDKAGEFTLNDGAVLLLRDKLK